MAKKKQPHTDRQASVVAHSLRCGVKTRKGTPCKLPAKQNGRCWIHGKKKAESSTEEFYQSAEIIPEYQIEPESTDEQQKSVEELTEAGDLDLEREKDAEIDAGSAEVELVIELDADAIEILEEDIQPETEEPPDSEETDDTGLEDSQLELLDDTDPGSDSIEIEPVIELDADSLEISTDVIQPELEEAYAGKPAEGQVAAEEWDDFTQTVEIEPPKAKPERIETEKSQKPDVGVVKKAFAVSDYDCLFQLAGQF